MCFRIGHVKVQVRDVSYFEGKKKKKGLKSLFLNSRRYAYTGELSSHRVKIQPSADVIPSRDDASKYRAGLLTL